MRALVVVFVVTYSIWQLSDGHKRNISTFWQMSNICQFQISRKWLDAYVKINNIISNEMQ